MTDKTSEPTNRPRTLADVARALDVDPSTVSLVLSGSKRISESTRKRVLEYCEKHNFRPNRLARGLSRGRSGLWGVVVPSIESSFFPLVLAGVEEVLHELGITPFISISGDITRLKRQLENMAGNRVEGLLVVPMGTAREREVFMSTVADIPTVWILEHLEGEPPESCLRVDNRLGAYLGTKHLIDHGHKRIGFLGGPPDSRSGSLREAGWRQALEEAGLSADIELRAGSSFSAAEGAKATKKLLSLPNPPTAVMASSDYAALGAIEVLLKHGKHPGQDFGVVGFDGICCARHSPIPLTTVNQPKRELGQMAARLLNKLIENEATELPVIKPELIIRRSCGCHQ